MIDGLTGIVLAGGRSSRFGSDKALADWGKTTLIQAVTASLLRVLPRVLVVTRKPAEFDFLRGKRVRVVADLHPEGHPLGGIHSGLRSLETGHALVRACDMPFLKPGLAEALWTARAHFDAVIPVWQGARQPMCGLYSRSCLGALEASIAGGELGISSLFDSLPTRFLLQGELESVDPDGLSFVDIDTREDYSRARALSRC